MPDPKPPQMPNLSEALRSRVTKLARVFSEDADVKLEVGKTLRASYDPKRKVMTLPAHFDDLSTDTQELFEAFAEAEVCHARSARVAERKRSEGKEVANIDAIAQVGTPRHLIAHALLDVHDQLHNPYAGSREMVAQLREWGAKRLGKHALELSPIETAASEIFLRAVGDRGHVLPLSEPLEKAVGWSAALAKRELGEDWNPNKIEEILNPICAKILDALEEEKEQEQPEQGDDEGEDSEGDGSEGDGQDDEQEPDDEDEPEPKDDSDDEEQPEPEGPEDEPESDEPDPETNDPDKQEEPEEEPKEDESSDDDTDGEPDEGDDGSDNKDSDSEGEGEGDGDPEGGEEEEPDDPQESDEYDLDDVDGTPTTQEIDNALRDYKVSGGGKTFNDIAQDELEAAVQAAFQSAEDYPYVVHPKVLAKDTIVVPEVDDEDRAEALYALMMSQLGSVVPSLRNKLLSVLIARRQSEQVFDQEEGYLDRSTLHELALPSDNVPRVFYQEAPGYDSKPSVALLIDETGSMLWGESEKRIAANKMKNRAWVARQTAIAMAETMSVLGIDFSVYGHCSPIMRQAYEFCFSDDLGLPLLTKNGKTRLTKLPPNARNLVGDDYFCGRVTRLELYQYKSFVEEYRRVKRRMTDLNHVGGTADGDAVLTIAKLLLQRQSQRKILVIFTDGSPVCEGRRSDDLTPLNYEPHHLVRVLEQVRQAGIEVLAVGILTDHVRRYYTNSVVVKKLDDMPTQVFEAFSKMLTSYKRSNR